MKFSNPLSADPRTSVFATLVAQVTVNGTTIGPYDVSSWDSLLVKLNSANGAGGANTVQIAWLDAAGNTLLTRNLVAGSNAGQIHARVRNVGPFVTLTFTSTNNGAVTVYTSNRPMLGDGPYSPSAQSELVYQAADAAMAIGASVVHTLWGTGGSQIVDGYCGRAILSIAGDGGTGCAVEVRRSSDAALVASVEATIPPTGSAGVMARASQEIVLPPEPCEVRVMNGGTAQNVRTSLVAA